MLLDCIVAPPPNLEFSTPPEIPLQSRGPGKCHWLHSKSCSAPTSFAMSPHSSRLFAVPQHQVCTCLRLFYLLFPEPETFHLQLSTERTLSFPSGLCSNVIWSGQAGLTTLQNLKALLLSLLFCFNHLHSTYHHLA